MSFAVHCALELLDKFEDNSRKAAKRPNPDAVHDVRVSIRRFRQCLRVFEGEFPSRAARKMDKRVRKLLKAAGALRNLDIAIALLKKARSPEKGLVRAVQRERASQARAFVDALEGFQQGHAVQKWRRKLSRKDSSGSGAEEAQAMAHALTPMLATQFFEAGDAAAEASSSGNDLHRFRIRTKKFRYTLELFTPVFGPALENEFASLREIQTRLGDINDCVATAALLDDFKKGHADAVRRSKRVLARSAALKMSGFREFWTKSFSQQQKAAWIAHLTSNDLSGVTPK